MSRPRIVILGGGFGGAYCAQRLERRLRAGEAECLVIDRNNFFVFYPLLVEAGTGSLQPRHAVIGIRSFLKRTRFRMAEVTAVDLNRRLVFHRIPGEQTVREEPYDHLIIALGSITLLPDVPGLHRWGWEMKSLSDAVALRDRAIQLLERADAAEDRPTRRKLLHFVVVGGSFTGAEVAGEFHVFLREASRAYRNVDPRDCTVTLIEQGQRILPALAPDLSEFAREHMVRRGIDIRLGTSAVAVDADGVTLGTGEHLASETVIWCAGIAPSPVIRRLDLPLDPRGYILCEPDMRVRGHDNVWAIGDCAVIPDRDGRPYPATAQHAVREGMQLADNLLRTLHGHPTQPCEIVFRGALAALGCRTGVANVFGYRLSGFPAWFLYRTVYLMKMPGWPRKARIALDWTLDLVFPREYVQLGVHRRPREESEPTQMNP